MFDHVAEFIGFRAGPTEFVPTGLDHQDIPLADIDHLVDHLGGINAGIADQLGDIRDDAGADPIGKRYLTDSAPVRIEVFLAVHMGGKVDAGIADGAIAAHAEELTANPLGDR